ncbi:MAG: replication initiator protein A, partial [Planctomycetales bacterium]|nr:replication initiator protein A [Planctomycetales bacterium]
MKRSARQKKQARNHIEHGRDEMNLVEFPYFTLSKRSSKHSNTLEFEDHYSDSKETVHRRVTIAGDPKYGLPTAREEELMLALLAVSKSFNNFRDPRVEFSQIELLETLGWGSEGKDYKRLERSFYTLNGARYRVNGWRDNRDKVFTKKGAFSLIGDFELNDSRKKKSAKPSDSASAMSYFVWGHVMFESFRSGYIKKLDLDLVRRLDLTASKRLFRYLDKYFHPPKVTELRFDLRELACKRIGVRKNADLTDIRRELEPAISELEQIGQIEIVTWPERVQKIRSGKYEITFRLQQSPAVSEAERKKDALIELLHARGVAKSGKTAAAVLVATCPGGHGQVESVIELYDENARLGKMVGPGFLVEGIRSKEGYSKPSPKSTTSKITECRPKANVEFSGADLTDRVHKLMQHWQQLSFLDRVQFETNAQLAASPMLRNRFRENTGESCCPHSLISIGRNGDRRRQLEFRDLILLHHFESATSTNS